MGLIQTINISIMPAVKFKIKRKCQVCGQEFIARPLNHGILPVSAGNQKNNLHDQSHWESERKNQKVHQIKAFIPFGRKTVYLSLMEIEWTQPIHNWGLIISIYAYVWKQNSDIRTNLQLNSVFIYTKFWTVFIISVPLKWDELNN